MDGNHFTVTNAARGLVFYMTVSGDITPGDPLTGTVNAFDIYDSAGHILVTTDGWNFSASDLDNASSLDAIFDTVSYSAVGNFVVSNQFNNSSVNFGGDTFLGDALAMSSMG